MTTKIIEVAVEKIKDNPNNPRKIQNDKIEKLKKSIQEFPEMLQFRTLVCVTDDEDGKFFPLGGNQRLRAIRELGIKKVPIMVADTWTEDQRNQFVVKDNVSFGEWDFGKLDTQFSFEAQINFGIDRDFSFKIAKNEPNNEQNDEPNNESKDELNDYPKDEPKNEERLTENNEIDKMQHPIKTGGEIIIKYQNEYERERISKILAQFSIKYSCR